MESWCAECTAKIWILKSCTYTDWLPYISCRLRTNVFQVMARKTTFTLYKIKKFPEDCMAEHCLQLNSLLSEQGNPFSAYRMLSAYFFCFRTIRLRCSHTRTFLPFLLFPTEWLNPPTPLFISAINTELTEEGQSNLKEITDLGKWHPPPTHQRGDIP